MVVALSFFTIYWGYPVGFGTSTWLSESKRALNRLLFWKLSKLWFSPTRYTISQWSLVGPPLAAGLPESSLHTHRAVCPGVSTDSERFLLVFIYTVLLYWKIMNKPWVLCAMAKEILGPVSFGFMKPIKRLKINYQSVGIQCDSVQSLPTMYKILGLIPAL